MKEMRNCFKVISIMFVCILVINITGCGVKVQSANLMNGIKSNTVTGKTSEDTFINSQMKLSVDMFQSAVMESRDENVLISPLSVQLALAMTANGACGETREEMEKLLGGNYSIEELNEYLYSYVKGLPSEEKSKLEIANSIWLRDDAERLIVEKEFLQTNADYYGAQAYKSGFDAQTADDINNWVSQHTDGMIDKIIDKIDKNTVMYLINALVFDAEWENVYKREQIFDDSFTDIAGENSTVKMMQSDEYYYLSDERATGFIKDYKGGKYSFAALLPNENIDIYEYISGLTDKSLLDILKNVQEDKVLATMPKFSVEYALSMTHVLAELGMPTAFDSKKADFSDMAKSSRGNIYIGDVLHKTFISVDELGTKAGAVTKVEMKEGCAPMEKKVVVLNRPFVYMIIDNSTKLPMFIGTVMDI